MKNRSFILLIIFFILSIKPLDAKNSGFKEIEKLIGSKDAILIADKNGKIVFQKNAQTKLIPASILKIFTSIMAISYLGKEYRFKTKFYIDKDSNLKIKGYGDPLLTSIEIKKIAKKLKKKIGSINDIILDESFYDKPVVVDGILKGSLQPYDSYNGAICVNFNTVKYKNRDGRIETGEKETPMLNFIKPKLKKLKLKKGRVLLAFENRENLIYAGKLFDYFLKEQKIKTSGRVTVGRVNKNEDRLILLHKSSFDLEYLIKNLLEYSNNFIANQIFMNVGAKIYGEPATLNKSKDVAKLFADTTLSLSLSNFLIIEGSGISRKNRVTAFEMLKILNRFEPHYRLLPELKPNFFCKTGTLKGVQSRAGFFETKGNRYRIVIIMNGENNTLIKSIVDRVIKKLRALHN